MRKAAYYLKYDNIVVPTCLIKQKEGLVWEMQQNSFNFRCAVNNTFIAR